MPTDKWGHPFLYPSKRTGGLGTGAPFFWQQANDIRNDSKVKGMTDTSGGGGVSDINTTTGEFTANYESSDSWTINKDPSFESSIGGSDMDFEATERRGFGYKADQPRDIELKVFAKWLDSSDDTGFSLSGPTGRHNVDPSCQGFAYMFSVEEPNTSPQKFRFRKEMYHVNYDDHPSGSFTHSKANFSMTGINRYVGLAYVRYNKKDGRGTGKDSVVVEGWINPDPGANKNNWIMMKRVEDKGGWGDGGDQCNGADDQVGTWSNAVFRVKASDMTIRFKNCSLREIDPSLDFDSDPTDQGGDTDNPNTQPTEVTGLLTLKHDINYYRTGACSPSGSVIFYNSPPDGNFWKFNVDQGGGEILHRIGMVCKDTSSVLNGAVLQEVQFYLAKSGSPTGTLTVRVRSSSGTVKATMGTLDVSTLSGSLSLISFINLSNTYRMVPGDKLLAEFNSGDASNYVMMGKRNSLSQTNGVSTKATYFDTAPATDVYIEFSTREISGVLLD